MLRVLVTGASSPLGEAVCRSLKRAGSHVTGTVRSARAGWSSPHVDELLVLDVEHASGFSVVRDGYDAAIHMAAAREGSPADLMATNGLGTAHLVDRAERVGIRRIVHVSSMAVYGVVTTPTVSARTPVGHSLPVGVAKWAAECYLADRHHAVRSVSIRSPGIAGSRARGHFLARTLRAMQLGEPAVRAANPDFPFNNLVHESVLADFLVHLAVHTPTTYTAVPVGSTDPMPLREIVETLTSSVGYRGRIEWVTAASTPFAIDSSDAVALGYRPISTRETVERWMRDVAADLNG
jgi:nucleoside-diphosphate-sugar epimerase